MSKVLFTVAIVCIVECVVLEFGCEVSVLVPLTQKNKAIWFKFLFITEWPDYLSLADCMELNTFDKLVCAQQIKESPYTSILFKSHFNNPVIHTCVFQVISFLEVFQTQLCIC